MYNIKIRNPKYTKSSPSLRQNIDKAMLRLTYLIQEEETYGTSFEKIFNNPAIKYDIFPNQYYTFKYHCNDSAQLRLLYKFIRNSDNSVTLELHDFYHKKRDDKKYIKTFQAIAERKQ